MFFWVDILLKVVGKEGTVTTTFGYNSLIVTIIVTYVFCCFCLQRILRKLKFQPDWLAWVPGLSFLAIYQAGGKSPWWTLALLGSYPLGTNYGALYFWWPLSLLTDKSALTNWQVLVPAHKFWESARLWVDSFAPGVSNLISLVQIAGILLSCFVLLEAAIAILKKLGVSGWWLLMLITPLTTWMLLIKLS